MTVIAAITGGIGSGKSTFSKEVIKRKIKLLDSDELVSQIYKKPNKEFISLLKKIGLKNAVFKNKIDKKYISNKIFSDKKTKVKLERYIFKKVREIRKQFILKGKKKKEKIMFVDIPLLFENNLSKDFDIVFSIISNKQNRYKRLRKTKKLSKDLFNKIIKTQTTDLVRIKKSDIIIKNNGTMEEYLKKINNVLDKVI